MKIILIETLDLLLITLIPSLIIVGLLILFSCGIYHVKKTDIYIIEKYNEYFKTLENGWYYFLPLIYHRAAKYKKGVLSRTIHLENGNDINIEYEIIDVKIYHYSKKKISDTLIELTSNKENITIDYLNLEFNKIGINIKNIFKI